ncbi:trace amine-associated receptor 13c-like [Actinia tenebrosa]|uniref:Trace amine-associated receptor 13c-like n=1 Tax=Actinia tenebrosa TaxID=6105 RepID=A0A6P8HZY5_ACTTE|nr:trace amine-associated receptor 13c-like [Actinia tenebrosa]
MDNFNNTSLTISRSTTILHSQETQFVESITNVVEYSSNLVAFLLTINIAMEILTILGNLTVIVTVVAYRQLWVPTNILVASLAVADFIIGLILQTSNALNLLNALSRGKRHCGLQCTNLVKITGVVIITVSFAHLSLITVDRYASIIYPLRYVTIVSMSRTKKAVLFAWAISFLFGLLTSIPSSFGKGISALWHLLVALTCVFMITLYGRLYLISRKHAKKIRDEIQSVTPGAETKQERRGLKSVAIVTVAMATSYVPIVALEIDKKLASGERGETAKLVHDIVSEKLRKYSCKLIKSFSRRIQEWFN